MEEGQQTRLAVGDAHSQRHQGCFQQLVHPGQKLRKPPPSQSRDGQAVGKLGQQGGCGIRVWQAINFVQGHDDRGLGGPQVVEHLPHRAALLQNVGMCYVNNVQKHVGLVDLFQGSTKGGHQHGGQLLDEADRIGEEHPPAAGQGHSSRRGIEGGKELVLHQHVGAGQGVEERGFAGVGVADQGDDGDGLPLAALPVLPAVGTHIFQFPTQMGNAPANLSLIHLQLCFTGAAQPDPPGAAAAGCAAGLPRQVRPGAGQPWQAVFVLGQLDL